MRATQTLMRAGLAGAIGGAVNGALCVLGWPVAAADSKVTFSWLVILGGCAHGCALALIAVAAAAYGRDLATPRRWAVSLLVGWIAGYVSWVPLDISLGTAVPKALMWPVAEVSPLVAALWLPFLYFGGVAALWYLWLSRRSGEDSVRASMLAASGAATAGSLYWWISWHPWYFSPLHGTIWGCLVGFAVASGHRRS
jgi:hypothetical protein